MTLDKQRIAIAEACGWKKVPSSVHFPEWEKDGQRVLFSKLPDCLKDLNATHEAEKTLTPEQHEAFCVHLRNVVTTPTLLEALFVSYWSRGFSILHASAPQRAEAFLRTLGLWTE